MKLRATPSEPFSHRVDVLRRWTHANGRWPSAVSRDDDERRLGRSVQTQRDRRRQGLLTAEVATILASIPGWTWGSGITGPNITRGDRRIQQFRTWMTTHPDMPRYLAVDRQERRLSDLVSRHRRRYRDGTLPAARVSALEGIPGWSWSSAGSRPFSEVAGELKQWIFEHDRLPSTGSKATAAERGLAVWVTGQRQRYRLGKLSAGATAALVAIPGWSWQERPRRTSPAPPRI